MAGKRGTKRGSSSSQVKESEYLRQDVETGRPPKDRKYRFRDNGNLEPDDQRRLEFKNKLLSAVEAGNKKLDGFRKSEDEVCFT